MNVEPTRVLSSWKAIAAMAENRVIGVGTRLPWHLPEDFKWFKQRTLGQTVVFGRKTFEGLGKPLPGRTNLVLSRRHPESLTRELPNRVGPALAGSAPMSTKDAGPVPFDGGASKDVRLVTSLDVIEQRDDPGLVFICGGAEVYAQALPRCSELFLTRVKRRVDGDAFFPPFEHLFDFAEVLRDTPEFTIERWVRKTPAATPAPAPA